MFANVFDYLGLDHYFTKMAMDIYERTKVILNDTEENHKTKWTLENIQARLLLHPGLKTTVIYILITLPIHRGS